MLAKSDGPIFQDARLPLPPTDAERVAYANPAPVGLSLSMLLLAIAFGYGSYLFVLDKPWWSWAYSAFAVVVCFGLLSSSYLYLISKRLDLQWWEYQKKWTYLDAPFLPSVDIFLPSCGEDISLLASNFYYVSQIKYPNYKVWVLDDAGKAEVKALASRYGFEYLAREGNEYKKSGNMRNCFRQSDGQLILVLDADFAPHAGILDDMVWAFIAQPDLGILQTPHYFRARKTDNPLQCGGSQLQSPFFRIVQNGRDKVGQGSAICCGSNAIYRRAALEPSGGSAKVPRSEDVATGLLVIAAGYKIRYVPLCLATGISPSSLRSYVNMVSRWCMGCYQIRFSRLMWNNRVPTSIKIAYLGSALSFFVIGFGIVGYPVPGLVNMLFYPESLTWANYSFIVPPILLLVFIRARWAYEPWGPSVFYASFVFAYTSLVATVDYFRGADVPWIATGQRFSKGSSYGRVLFLIRWVPQVCLALCLAGVFKNWALIPDYAWIPTTTFWALRFWCSRLVLSQAASEAQTDLTLKVVEELRQELEISKQLNTISNGNMKNV